MNNTQKNLLSMKVCANPKIGSQYKKFLKEFLPAVQIEDVGMGDPRAFSGYEVLIIVAKAKGVLGLKMDYYSDLYYPNPNHNFYIVVGVNDEYEGAIEIYNHNWDPVGFIDINSKINGGDEYGDY